MDRKELVVVLLLVALVLVAATVRIFWGPVSTERTHPPPVAAKASRGGRHHNPSPLLAVSIWPPPPERMLPKDKAALRLFEAAETAGAEGLFEPAIQIYDQSPFLPLALLWCGESYLELGEPERARLRLTEVVAHHASSPFAKRAKARLEQLKERKGAVPPRPPTTKNDSGAQ